MTGQTLSDLHLANNPGQPAGDQRNTRQDWYGQHSKQRHQTSLGQAGQTSRNIRNVQHKLSQMIRSNSKAQEQTQYKRHTAIGHTYPTEVGVQYAYKQEADNNHPKQASNHTA